MPRQSIPKPLIGEVSQTDLERGQSFANWLRRAREAKGWLKKDLALASEVSNTYIGVLENNGINNSTGSYQRPSEEIIERLAAALGADEDQGRRAAGYNSRPGRTLPELTRELSDEEWELIELFRGVRPEQRDLYLRLMASSVEVKDKEPNPEDVPLVS